MERSADVAVPAPGAGSGAVLQRYRLTLMTPWTKAMLKLYCDSVVLMDASYGLDVYNYPLVVLMVVDRHQCGIPVAFGVIASHEGKDDVAGFIRDVEELAGVTLRRFLIDKGTGEIAALEALGREIFLCHFHMKKVGTGSSSHTRCRNPELLVSDAVGG